MRTASSGGRVVASTSGTGSATSGAVDLIVLFFADTWFDNGASFLPIVLSVTGIQKTSIRSLHCEPIVSASWQIVLATPATIILCLQRSVNYRSPAGSRSGGTFERGIGAVFVRIPKLLPA